MELRENVRIGSAALYTNGENGEISQGQDLYTYGQALEIPPGPESEGTTQSVNNGMSNNGLRPQTILWCNNVKGCVYILVVLVWLEVNIKT